LLAGVPNIIVWFLLGAGVAGAGGRGAPPAPNIIVVLRAGAAGAGCEAGVPNIIVLLPTPRCGSGAGAGAVERAVKT
jgi:hypothetical protein